MEGKTEVEGRAKAKGGNKKGKVGVKKGRKKKRKKGNQSYIL